MTTRTCRLQSCKTRWTSTWWASSTTRASRTSGIPASRWFSCSLRCCWCWCWRYCGCCFPFRVSRSVNIPQAVALQRNVTLKARPAACESRITVTLIAPEAASAFPLFSATRASFTCAGVMDFFDRFGVVLRAVREQITSCFEKISCFGLTHPGFHVVKKTFKGEISKIQPSFLRLLNAYVRHIFGDMVRYTAAASRTEGGGTDTALAGSPSGFLCVVF